MSDSQEMVLMTRQDGIARIVLNRVDKRNAVNNELMTQMANHIGVLESDDNETNVVLLSAEGPIFSAGIDLNYASGLLGATQSNGLAGFDEEVELLQGTITRLSRLPMPSVAAIQGPCIGLGMEMALGADIRIASENATFALPEIKLSLVADCGGTTRVTRLVGPSWARYLLLTGDNIDAQTALSIGLIHEVVPEDQLQSRAEELVASLGRRNPTTLAHFKKLIETMPDIDEDACLKAEIDAQKDNLLKPEFLQYMMAGLQEMSSRKKK